MRREDYLDVTFLHYMIYFSDVSVPTPESDLVKLFPNNE